MGRFLGITVKVAPCLCLDGHIKEPKEMSMALDPDRRSNLFSEHAHQCAATCISEISLIETLFGQNEPEPKIDISGKKWIYNISNLLKMSK